MLPFKFSLFRRDRARKSGGPSLFEPSLKVQRDFAHNPPSGFEVLPRCYDLNVHEARKVRPTRRRGEPASAICALEVIGLYMRSKRSPQTRQRLFGLGVAGGGR